MVTAAPGDILLAELKITPDANGVSSFGVTVEFDLFPGFDELNFVSLVLVPDPVWDIQGVGAFDTESFPGITGAVDSITAANISDPAPHGKFSPLPGRPSTTGYDEPRPRVFAHCLLGSNPVPAASRRRLCNCLGERELHGAQGRKRP